MCVRVHMCSHVQVGHIHVYMCVHGHVNFGCHSLGTTPHIFIDRSLTSLEFIG